MEWHFGLAAGPAEGQAAEMPARDRPGEGRDDLVRVALLTQEAEDRVERRETDRAFAQALRVEPVFVKGEARWQNVRDTLMQAGDKHTTDARLAHG